MATNYYVDYEGGNNANTGLSYAQRVKTIAGLAGKGVVAGDTCRLMASLDPITLGSCTWTTGSQTVTIPAGTTKDVDMCETAWTAGVGITSTADSTLPKQGTFNSKLVIGGGYVAGTLMAYKALAGATDFSGYQQLCLWFHSTATTAAGDYEVRLCSDAAGVTAVDTFAIPAIAVASKWHPVVVNKGSAMGVAIQSVAIYRIAGAGTPTVQMDCVMASKAVGSADELTLLSLIGKDDNRGWWVIQSVTGTTLKLDGGYQWGANQFQTWYGTTGAATTYLRQPINLGYNVTQTSSLAGSATAGYITFSGGWNRTDMSTQTGETFYANPVGNGTTFNQQQAWVAFEKLSFYGGVTAWLATSGKNQKFTNCYWGGGTIGLCAPAYNKTNFPLTICAGVGGDSSVINMGSGWVVKNSHFTGGNSYSFRQGGCNGFFESCSFGAAPTHGLQLVGMQFSAQGYNNVFRGCSFGAASTADILADSGPNYFDNCLMSSTTEVQVGFAQGAEDVFFSTNHDQTADSHTQWMYGGRVFSEASVRHTASGLAWKLTPTNSNRNADYPLRLTVATPYVRAGSLVTVKMWMRRDSVSISGKLFVRSGQLGGPATEQTASIAAAINTWEELTITWTPATAGVVEIEALAYGGTTLNLYVDDMTISQA